VTPIETLRAARHLGLTIEADGERLQLNARLPPPAWLRDALRLHKAQILALLRPAERGMTEEEWAEFHEERAGILEHDSGLHRLDAGIRAHALTEMERIRPGLLIPVPTE
jgi:hypothetical protein